jgi:dTDP-4-dehydrorhamnose reductase
VKILLTGVSGLLGLNAAAVLRERHVVVGAYLDHPVALQGVSVLQVDMADEQAVNRWLERERPDLVWHTAGLTNVETCESSPDLAQRLNVGAAEHVAAAAARVGAGLIHVSTDHLFDGTVGRCAEATLASPLNVYAATKLEAERQVDAVHATAFILRTNFFGWGHARRRSLSDWIIDGLRQGETRGMFDDVYFTPMLANDLVDTGMALFDRGKPGLYHVAGGERLSKFAFGVAVAERFRLDARLIQPRSVETFTFEARRPRDMSLATEKVTSVVGYAMPDVDTAVERLARLEARGWPAMLAAATRP